MKIHVEGLATIKEATVDLRPLTVIIGPNNSAKTWLAYSIYGVVGATHATWLPDDDGEFLAKALEAGFSGPSGTLSAPIQALIVDHLTRMTAESIQGPVNQWGNQFPSFLQLDPGSKNPLGRIDVELGADDNAAARVALEGLFHQLFVPGTRPNLRHLASALQTHGVVAAARTRPSPFVLPAERGTLILTYKILANRRIRHLRQQNLVKFAHQGDPDYAKFSDLGEYFLPQPVEDFLDFLAAFDSGELERSRSERDQDNGGWEEVAHLVERHLHGGNRLTVTTNDVGGRHLRIAVPRGPKLSLYNASSSIKQLTPLLLYLRFRARKGDLLVIDEPEANLHPENQVKLLEILAILVNLGVKVLITTHSPYFMQHLNNLILGHPDPGVARKQKKYLYLKDARAFLKPEEVSAYELKNQQDGSTDLVDLRDPDFGTLTYNTLGDTFSDLRRRFVELDTLRHPAGSADGR